MTTLALLLLSVVPVQSEPVRYHVDLIEANTYIDDQGRTILSQHIFWLWYHDVAEFHVADWRLAHGNYPERTATGWRMVFNNHAAAGENGLIIVEAPSYIETWSMTDPERDDLARLADNERWKIGRDMRPLKHKEKPP